MKDLVLAFYVPEKYFKQLSREDKCSDTKVIYGSLDWSVILLLYPSSTVCLFP